MAKKRPFNELDRKTRTIVILSLFAVILLASLMIFFTFLLFMTGIFQLTDVTYETRRALVWFAMLLILVGFLLGALGKFISILLYAMKLPRNVYFHVKLTISFFLAWAAVYIVNQIITSVTMHYWSQWVFAGVLIAADYAIDGRKLKREKLA
ncbi:YrvL family regulatory protein [Halobacillus massiliensis]|uniref:YrvL family regulatory protein n=1 Tax=Halobacillus massiliensis TaxID=1926286 RepID=UPI0015C48122|nr:YrvL family regulatory protein [Halobacillus massiliensis]